MAEQVGPATAGGVMASPAGHGGAVDASASAEPAPFISQVPGTPTYFPSFHGRAISWVCVSLILLGFLTGGLGLVFGPTWVAFWIGIALAAVGGLTALGTNIFDDWY
jgi:hypothetical protein